MPEKNSYLVMVAIVHVMLVLVDPMNAFVIGTTSKKATGPSLSTVFYMNDEGSEWYTPPSPKKSTTAAPAETVVNSSEELRSFLSNQKTDGRLTIVTYHASWCRSCARFKLHLNKIKQDYAGDRSSDRRGKVRFASVEFGANTALCAEQSVTRLPTTRLYYQNKLVQEFTKGASEITRVQDAIKYYVSKWKRDERKALSDTLESGNKLVSEVMTDERGVDSSSVVEISSSTTTTASSE